MPEQLTDLLISPPAPIDQTAWRAARRHAWSVLSELAHTRRGASPLRITEHDVRMSFDHSPAGSTDAAPFAWSALTARRALGLAAVRSLLDGHARTPVDAVRARAAESARIVGNGGLLRSGLDSWLAGLTPAARSAVGAEAVTWATRLWCALDWRALPPSPVIGRDRWWDSPRSALLALRSRVEVRTATANLVVLSGPRRASARAELALVTLVETLCCPDGSVPGRVIGWWPDSGHTVRVAPDPEALRVATDAVARVLALPPARSAA